MLHHPAACFSNLLIITLMCVGVSRGTEPSDRNIKVLVISGQNNHNWKKTNPYLHWILDHQEHIEATVHNTPETDDSALWQNWQPQFSEYDVVLLNYNGQSWPESIRKKFEVFIRTGGGAIVIHASNNLFNGWDEYEKMVGLLWRDRDYGTSLFFDAGGNVVRELAGKGRKMGHGSVFDWVVSVREMDHPVTKGMPKHWMHCQDELYHGQRGPAQNINMLMTAYSDPKQGGSGQHEPVLWWVPYGEGKVVTNLMGHVWSDGQMDCLECVGFQTILTRSCEWLGTGNCRNPIPDNFPIVNRISKNKRTNESNAAE